MPKSIPTPAAARNKAMLILIAIIASTGGLLFGFDTGVISGAIPFLRQDLGLTPGQVEDLTALGLLGAVAGALVGGPLSDVFGRKKVIFVSAFVFASGAVWAGLSPNVLQLMLSRLYLGLAIGVSSFSVPLYLAEIAPTKYRGRLVSLFQLLITIGILASYLSDSLLADNAVLSSWRPMFFVGTVPALVLFIGMLFVPESPRWLLSKGREEEGRAALRRLGEEEGLGELVEAMKQDLNHKVDKAGWRELLSPWLRAPLMIAVGIMFIQQFVGINTVIYYSPEIFLRAGFQGNSAAIWASVSVGVINVLMTLVSLYLVDRVGRRKLYFLGLWGMVFALVVTGLGIAGQATLGDSSKWMLVASILVYCAFFSISLGPLGWLYVSEVFPLRVRGLGTSIGSLANWGFNTTVAWTFFKLVQVVGMAQVFWLFAAVGILGLVWGYFCLPETRGVSLEQIESHWRSRRPIRSLRPAGES